MSLVLRIFLIVVSFISIIYVIRRIRKAKLRIDYSLFWIIVSVLIMLLAIFPGIAIKLATMMGVMSAVNLIYLVMIFILLLHNFSMTMKISSLDSKINNLTEEIAIREKMNTEKKEEEYDS